MLCPSGYAPSPRRNARSGDPTFHFVNQPDRWLPRPPVLRTFAEVRELVLI
jgi:hypothetical protein